MQSTARLALAAALWLLATPAQAQRADTLDLSRLIAHAVSVSPTIRAAEQRVIAAQARVSPAGQPPDPMVMAGLQNVPLGRMRGASGPEPMTMRMVGVEQTIPYPGKLALDRAAALHEVDAARANAVAERRQVIRDVEDAYYELAFIDRADSIVARNRDVLAGLIAVTETRYGVGTAGQEDVLKARVEATRLAETAAALRARRLDALARLNAAMNLPSDTPLRSAAIPVAIARAAVSDSAAAIHFASSELGAPAADSPLPSLHDLQEIALSANPDLRARAAMIAAQESRLELARKGSLPDLNVSLQYGQRGGGLPDMVTAMVSVPVPVFARRKQGELTANANATLSALEADLSRQQNEIRLQVAQIDARLEQDRTQLALYVKALLPQARAALTSATANYQVSRVDFLTVLDDQATVFNYETEYFRSLSDFARSLAELERIVGQEVLP
jgi:outer membrane protein TolC